MDVITHYIKMYAMLKDVRAAVREEYNTGNILNILLSRKVIGLALVLAAYAVQVFFEITIDDATVKGVTENLALFGTAAVQIFGVIMQLVSYGKTIKNAVTKEA